MIAYACTQCNHTFTRIEKGPSKGCPQCGAGPLFLTVRHADGPHKYMDALPPRIDGKMRAANDIG